MNGDLYANDYFHVDNQLLPIRWMAWEAVALVHNYINYTNTAILRLIRLTDALNQDVAIFKDLLIQLENKI